MEITLTQYRDLEPFVKGFRDGHLGLLVIVGGAGLQKSTLVEETLGDAARYIDGTASGFELFREAWRHRGKPIVIDDVDRLYADRSAVRLLKGLCDTREIKRVAWHTASSLLDAEEIPREFETTSRVIIIANEWKALNKNVGAVQDRGTVIHFKPSAGEVHGRVAAWFDDGEILGFVAEHLHLIAESSMRLYVESLRLKNAGLDWRSALLATWGVDPTTAEAARIECDASLPTREEKAAAFTSRTGKSRRTYFYVLGRYRRGRENLCTFAPPSKSPVQECSPTPASAPQIEPPPESDWILA